MNVRRQAVGLIGWFFITFLAAALGARASISAADFYALPAFPDVLEVGLGVTRLAGSTVEYRLALFRPGETQACAAGSLVQVFIERSSGQPATAAQARRLEPGRTAGQPGIA